MGTRTQRQRSCGQIGACAREQSCIRKGGGTAPERHRDRTGVGRCSLLVGDQPAGMYRWDQATEEAGRALQLAPDDEHYRKIYDLFRETGGKDPMMKLDDRSTTEHKYFPAPHPPE